MSDEFKIVEEWEKLLKPKRKFKPKVNLPKISIKQPYNDIIKNIKNLAIELEKQISTLEVMMEKGVYSAILRGVAIYKGREFELHVLTNLWTSFVELTSALYKIFKAVKICKFILDKDEYIYPFILPSRTPFMILLRPQIVMNYDDYRFLLNFKENIERK